MSKRFLSTINLPKLASDPVSGSEGDIYYNTTSDKIKYYNGSTWEEVAGAGADEVFYQNSAPSSPTLGDIWIDADSDAIGTSLNIDLLLPSQTNNSGKYLTTNGTSASWGSISGFATTSALSSHESDTTNVHGITDTANIVLTNDARLSDSRTPTAHASTHTSGGSDEITIAQSQVTNLTTDLASKIPSAEKGAPNGVATLDGNTKIPSTQLPAIAITSTFVVVSEATMLALTAQEGDVAVRSDLNKSFILAGSDPTILANWQELLTPTDVVQSVDGRTGTVSLSDLYDASGSAATAESNANSYADSAVSTHNLDTTSVHGISNTADLVYTNDSRLSDSRIPTAHASSHQSGGADELTLAQSQITNLSTDLAAKAPLSSPTFTGIPAAPTAPVGTNTTQIATTAFTRATASGQGLLITESTGSRTLSSSDAGMVILLSNNTSNTITLPSSTFTEGTRIDFIQTGTGTTTFTTSGITLSSKDNKTSLTGQYSASTVIYTSSSTAVLIGDLA